MAVPFSNTKLRVPKGFQNILEGFAREVLRNQPENAYEFGLKYFEKLLKVRQETGHDPAVHGAKLEDRFYNNDSFKSPSIDPSCPQQQDAALTIQTGYRKHAAEQEVEKIREEEAAEKIQAGFRGYQDRQRVKELRMPEHSKNSEVDIDLSNPEFEAAAVKIQAGFKGFKTRQELKDKKDHKRNELASSVVVAPKAEEEIIDIDFTDPDFDKAATKIQAGFRGHQTRLEVKKMRESRELEQTHDVKADFDDTDPEVVDAAIKIQAGFKGMKARQDIKAMKEAKGLDREENIDMKLSNPDTEEAQLNIKAGFDDDNTINEKETQRESEDEAKHETNIDNSAEMELAATKIQAGFKGYRVRQELKAKREKHTVAAEDGEEVVDETEDQDKGEADINYNDPEAVKAATKIQAGFKGYKTRQEIRRMKLGDKKDEE